MHLNLSMGSLDFFFFFYQFPFQCLRHSCHSSRRSVAVAFGFELTVVVCKGDLSEANTLPSRALELPRVVYVFVKGAVLKLLAGHLKSLQHATSPLKYLYLIRRTAAALENGSLTVA